MEIKHAAVNFLASAMLSPLVATKSCFKILVVCRICAPLLEGKGVCQGLSGEYLG